MTTNLCIKDKPIGQCIKEVTKGCQEPIDLEQFYQLNRMLSGGKSGAFLFLIQPKQVIRRPYQEDIVLLNPIRYILKFYPDAYNDQGKLANERPFREVATLCRMSGVSGFPCLYNYGCCQTPRNWLPKSPIHVEAERGLFAVMSLAKGTPLMDLDLKQMSPMQVFGIIAKLLILLFHARERMGKTFEHFDLHPDNIFIDLDHCMPLAVPVNATEVLTIKCPSVSLIDFDLVQSDFFKPQQGFSSKPLPEHRAKRENKVPVPERTLSWAQKWLGLSGTLQLMQEINNMKIQNTDIRNWMVISKVLSKVNDISWYAEKCNDMIECIRGNLDLFQAFYRHPTFVQPQKPDKPAKILQVDKTLSQKVKISLFQLFVTKSPDILRTWQDFESMVYRETNRFPFADSFHLQIDLTFQRIKESDALVFLEGLVLRNLHDIQVRLGFKQLMPKITVQFGRSERTEDALWITGEWNILRPILRTTFIALAGAQFLETLLAQFPRREVIKLVKNEDKKTTWLSLKRIIIESAGADTLQVDIQFFINQNVLSWLLKFVQRGNLSEIGNGLWSFKILVPLDEKNPCQKMRETLLKRNIKEHQQNVIACRQYYTKIMLIGLLPMLQLKPLTKVLLSLRPSVDTYLVDGDVKKKIDTDLLQLPIATIGKDFAVLIKTLSKEEIGVIDILVILNQMKIIDIGVDIGEKDVEVDLDIVLEKTFGLDKETVRKQKEPICRTACQICQLCRQKIRIPTTISAKARGKAKLHVQQPKRELQKQLEELVTVIPERSRRRRR